MKSICIYGKGGIGKSTVSSNVAAALSKKGLKVLLIGCDPKSDSSRNIIGKRIPTVLATYRKKQRSLCEADILFEGYNGVHCIETGGPRPGQGCAGRGIVTAIQLIKDLNILEKNNYDIVIYDVLGDVVCGGFSLPLKESFVDEAYIVTTCDYMALFAANNICYCINKYSQRGKIKLGGIIHNGRSVIDDNNIIKEFCNELGTKIIGHIPMDRNITKAEINSKTVIEYCCQSKVANCFDDLAENIYNNEESSIPRVLDEEKMDQFSIKIDNILKDNFEGEF